MDVKQWLIIGCVVMFFSCDQEGAWDCIKTSGNEDSERRNLSYFNAISIVDEIELELVYDSLQFVTVHGGGNLIGKVRTEVLEGVLEISNENFCDPVRSLSRVLKVEVHTPTLEHIYSESVRNIYSKDTLRFPHLVLEVFNGVGEFDILLAGNFSAYVHSGSIDLNLAGRADSLYLYNLGLGFISAEKVITPYCHVNHQSTGDVKVFSSGYLNLENYGLGDIYYYGTPSTITIKEIEKENVFQAD